MSRGSSVAAGKGRPLKRTAAIRNARGLHARAAGKFAKLAGSFDAEVMVGKGDQDGSGQYVSGLSIMGMMMLAAGKGSKLRFTAIGDRAEEVLDEIAKLFERNFEED